jgi:hypothetical protein
MLLGCEVCAMEIIWGLLAAFPFVGGTLACWLRRVRRRKSKAAI